MAIIEEIRQTQGRETRQESDDGQRSRWSTLAWWAFLLTGLLFGGYALYLGSLEIAGLLGLVQATPVRAAPGAFVVHSLAGAVTLLAGPLQFRRQIRVKKPALHRALGRAYVGSAWIASIGGFWSALFFDRGLPARIIFVLVAALWFGATTLAYRRARSRRFKAHAEWMVRSFALSLFFVSFPLWTEGLAATPLPGAVGYPLGLFLAGGLNLAIAEWWIRAGRAAAGGASG